ncbi:hypothetical protein MRB53_037441 [Persea americana]|nr:hypothetical protein MRB53_037441 [Persea americana]
MALVLQHLSSVREEPQITLFGAQASQSNGVTTLPILVLLVAATSLLGDIPRLIYSPASSRTSPTPLSRISYPVPFVITKNIFLPCFLTTRSRLIVEEEISYFTFTTTLFTKTTSTWLASLLTSRQSGFLSKVGLIDREISSAFSSSIICLESFSWKPCRRQDTNTDTRSEAEKSYNLLGIERSATPSLPQNRDRSPRPKYSPTPTLSSNASSRHEPLSDDSLHSKSIASDTTVSDSASFRQGKSIRSVPRRAGSSEHKEVDLDPTDQQAQLILDRSRMMHQTSSRLLRMTEDDRPFTRVCFHNIQTSYHTFPKHSIDVSIEMPQFKIPRKSLPLRKTIKLDTDKWQDFKDLFSTLMVSLPLTSHRVRFSKVEHTFTTEEAITNLGSLQILPIKSNARSKRSISNCNNNHNYYIFHGKRDGSFGFAQGFSMQD